VVVGLADAASDLRHHGSGRYSYRTNNRFLVVFGSEVQTPLLAGVAGNPQRQGSQQQFSVPVWVPHNPFPESNLQEEAVLESIRAGGADPAQFRLTVRAQATRSAFLSAISAERPLFALIAHTTLHPLGPGEPPQATATGLCLADWAIMSTHPALHLLINADCDTGTLPIIRQRHIAVGSQVTFFAGCRFGPIMQDMLQISDSTPGRAVIFARASPHLPRLHVGAAVLGKILAEWRGGTSLEIAVQRANAWNLQQNWGTSRPQAQNEQYDVIGLAKHSKRIIP
jgi:hypothetical protein